MKSVLLRLMTAPQVNRLMLAMHFALTAAVFLFLLMILAG